MLSWWPFVLHIFWVCYFSNEWVHLFFVLSFYIVFLTFLVFCFLLADGKHHFVGSCLANVYSNVCVLYLIFGITVGQLIMGLSSILTL